MKSRLIIILLIISFNAFSQELGIGIVKIEFNQNTVLEFFESPNSNRSFRRIEFYDDTTIHSFAIKNFNGIKRWLKPEILWTDYSQLGFRCKCFTKDWLEVVINNDDGSALWIKKSEATKFFTWEEFLKNVYVVSRMNEKQPIKDNPNSSANEIQYKGSDCFKVNSMKGEWIEIYADNFCDDNSTESVLKSGWIRWRDGNKLLIEYFLTS
jgi:hypothetical protein